MNPSLTKNIVSSAGQTVVQTAILLLLYRHLIHTLGVEKLGIWSVVLASASASRVSELGLSGSATKFVAAYRARGDERRAVDVLQTAAISLGVVAGSALLLLYPALSSILQYVLPASALAEGREILPLALVAVWLVMVSGIWASGLDGCLRSDVRAGIMIAGSLVFLAFSLLTVGRYGLVGLVLAQVVQGLLLVVGGWIAVRRILGPAVPLLPIRWDQGLFREMLSYGLSFQVNSLAMLLLEPTTKMLLSRFAGLATTGYFELVQRMVMAARNVLVEGNRVVVPVIAALHEADRIRVRELYAKNVQYLCFLLTSVFATFAALVPVVSELWLGKLDPDFVLMALFLIGVWYFNGGTSPAYFAYLGIGRLRWNTAAHVLMGATNAALGLLLGHLWGGVGVIVAFGFSVILGSVIPVIALHQENGVRLVDVLSRRDLAHIIACVCGAVTLLAAYDVYQTELSKWLRVGSTLIAVPLVFGAIAWGHPLRRHVMCAVSARFQSVRT